MGDYRSAIESFSKALSFDHTHYESFFGRGNCYYQLEDFHKALRDYDKAVELLQKTQSFGTQKPMLNITSEEFMNQLTATGLY